MPTQLTSIDSKLKAAGLSMMTTEMGVELARRLKMDGYCECSALSGDGVEKGSSLVLRLGIIQLDDTRSFAQADVSLAVFDEALRLARLGPRPERPTKQSGCVLL